MHRACRKPSAPSCLAPFCNQPACVSEEAVGSLVGMPFLNQVQKPLLCCISVVWDT